MVLSQTAGLTAMGTFTPQTLASYANFYFFQPLSLARMQAAMATFKAANPTTLGNTNLSFAVGPQSGVTFSAFSIVDDAMNAIFSRMAPKAGTQYDFTMVDPGLLSVNFPAYFATCAPAQCSYTTATNISPSAALAAALGIIGGATKILNTAVDVGVGVIVAAVAQLAARAKAAEKPISSTVTAF
jgi:hypothetical protein